MLGNLTEAECAHIINGQVWGRLACCEDNKPYIIPVTYTYQHPCIYGQTNEGQKLNMLRKNPTVCFEVEQVSDMRNWKCVLAYGTFEELSGEEAEKARSLLFNNVFQLMTSSTVHLHEHDSGTALDDSGRIKYVMYRIRIDSMTGRFEKQ